MTSSGGPERRALIIGIDSYREAPPMRGCTNDAKLMEAVLRAQGGFQAADIRVLEGAEATRAAILGALEAIRAEAGEGTRVFLFFAGWGVRLPAGGGALGAAVRPWDPESAPAPQDGAGAGPEVAYESALVPHDWREGAAGSAIRHEELRAWLAGLPTSKVTVVLDAPYSGTLLGAAPAASGPVFLGASRGDEVCFEIVTGSAVAHGALTYFLAQALLRGAPGLTFRKLFEEVSARVAARLPFQHPQIEGAIDQAVFEPLSGADAAAPPGAVRVAAREGGTVTLAAGAAAGVTAGSWWSVHPEGAPLDPDGEKLGVVEITGVSASEAKARVLSELVEGAIGAGAGAVEDRHDHGEMRLRVGIEGGDGAEEHARTLVRILEGVELLRLVAPGEPGDVIVRYAPEGARAAGWSGDEAWIMDEAVWLIEDDTGVDGAGRPLQSRPLFLPIQVSSPYDVRLALEQLSRYRNLLSLANPNPRSPLAGKVDLVLSRLLPDGSRVPVEADASARLPVLHQGDVLRVEVHNHHDRPVYAAVFDLGLSMSLTPLASGVLVGPGSTARVLGESWEDESASVYFPEQVPAASGVETLKLFATAYPVDLGSILLQEGGRGARGLRVGAATELWQILDQALTGRGPRERRPVQLPPDQEWTVVERTFELRREGR